MLPQVRFSKVQRTEGGPWNGCTGRRLTKYISKRSGKVGNKNLTHGSRIEISSVPLQKFGSSIVRDNVTKNFSKYRNWTRVTSLI